MKAPDKLAALMLEYHGPLYETMNLDDGEAKQLVFLSWWGFGKRTEILSFWRWLLSSVRESYSLMDHIVVGPRRCNAMEKDVHYLRELGMLEVICKDSNTKKFPIDLDKVHCTQFMWQKFVWSTPLSFTNSLTLMLMKAGEKTVLHVTDSSNTKIIPFPPYRPAPWLWKDCPRMWTDSKGSSKLERCPMPHQYGQESLLLRYTEALCILSPDYLRTQKGVVGLLG